MTLDCIVVGAGPAGLSASAALTEEAVEHVVLERGRVGQSWRRQRWDSFRLNTPGRMNAMLRPEALDEYLVGTEVVGRLEKLAAEAPVHEGVAVRGLVRTDDGFSLRTDGGDLTARTVIIASGDQNVPVRPALAAAFPDAVAQYHTADYRKADDLPAGAVLVVGSAQSGCQIAEDLLRAGRRVVLSTSPVGRLPWRHRGRDTVDWLLEIAFFDQRRQDLPDPLVMRAAQPIVASGGRSLGLQEWLERARHSWAGRQRSTVSS